MPAEDPLAKMPEELIKNGCRFRCKYCNHETPSWGQMSKHLKRRHQVKKRHDPFDLVIDLNIFDCHKCKKPILKDRGLIYNHMLSSHKITIPRLPKPEKGSNRIEKLKSRNPDFVKNECTFRCNYCSEISECWEAARRHHSSNHKNMGPILPARDSVIESKFHSLAKNILETPHPCIQFLQDCHLPCIHLQSPI